MGAIGAAGGFSLQSSKNLSAGEGGLFVTNDDAMAEEAALRCATSARTSRAPRDVDFDDLAPARRHARARLAAPGLDVPRQRDDGRLRPRPARRACPSAPRDASATPSGSAQALAGCPASLPPKSPAGRTSVHHKFRVHLDPERGPGLKLSPRQLRESTIKALCGPRGSRSCSGSRSRSRRRPSSSSALRLAGFSASPARAGPTWLPDYDPARYPRTSALLAGSLVLFSQSCPLIAQDDASSSNATPRRSRACGGTGRHALAKCGQGRPS